MDNEVLFYQQFDDPFVPSLRPFDKCTNDIGPPFGTPSEAARTWQSKGVEMMQADFNDVNNLVAAFQGANVIFGSTDFWTIFEDETNITQYCFEVELQQARNLAGSAAQIPTMERYIFSSMANATKWSHGKFRRLYHMDSKALAAVIYYNLPWEWGLPTTPKIALLTFDVPIPLLDVRRDFVSESLSWNQYLDIWCQSQGVPRGKCDQASLEKEFGENVLFAQEFGYEGCDCPANRVSVTSFQEYCNQTNFSKILRVCASSGPSEG
ncbi:hypothetical protein POJ06DRAFT_283783 [Lipomyces tetrasporus]|uniref:NmrA-like domain-containing protein n=1 Tax=Lipomyces tetrasporus TaxID=54092 RepID=A0AAD7QLR0_9ASCO|nr:uncharacterized protein POJ06DRAFT_283783 [Lipomyces tetrasporus]KAJ8097191.1 hypothetical protein POJ06DRAFT_283783 [Lipomyces tetrasporus]